MPVRRVVVIRCWWAVTDWREKGWGSEKSSVFGLKVSKILNRAVEIKKLLGFYGVGVTYLQYFCGGKKIV